MEPRYPLSSAEFKMDNVGQDIDDSDVYSTPASASLPEGKRPPADLSNGRFLQIPPELLYKVLLLLDPLDLVAVSATCRGLHAIATEDYLWKRIVQEQVPGVEVTSPYPCPSFYHLYGAHHLRWFLPKNKIWFSDTGFTGKLAVARYDPRTGNIEAYQLLAINAEKGMSDLANIDHGGTSIVYRFKPTVKLHMDRPIVRLAADGYGYGHELQKTGLDVVHFSLRDDEEVDGDGNTNRLDAVTTMVGLETRTQAGAVWNRTFMLAYPDTFTPVPQDAARHMGLLETVWPPPTIPAQHRINIINWQLPRSRAEVSDQAFRIGTRLPGNYVDGEADAWATLDSALYTPTPRYPFRGIFVGDYGPHNCEFILIHQPEDSSFDPDSVIKRHDESDEQFAKRKSDEIVYRGRLEAIKLTGDPNVPRGMHTFIVEDLSDKGHMEQGDEQDPFGAATVVRSKGHIALHGFMNDTYIDSNLIIINHNRLAQHWIDSHHISFFDRVHIDSFTGI